MTVAPRPSEVGRCTVAEVDRYPLILENGDHAYIEPQVALPLLDGFLVAGAPSYEWRVTDQGAWSVGNGALLGLLVRSGQLQPIVRPPGVTSVAGVRVAQHEGGRLAWMLEESAPRGGMYEPGTDRVLYAETSESEWKFVEEVPLRGGVRHSFRTSSPLVRFAGRTHWLVPVRDRGGSLGALLYERWGGVWRTEVVSEEHVEAVALSSDGTGLLTGVAGRDPNLGLTRFSLRARSTGGGTPERRVATFSGRRAAGARFISGPGGVMATWLLSGGSTSSAWAADLASKVSGYPLPVDASALSAVPVVVRNEPLVVVHHHNAVTGIQELRVYHIEDGAVRRVASWIYPYAGPFAAVASGVHELSVIGPEFDPTSPHPFVRSLVLRLSVLCT